MRLAALSSGSDGNCFYVEKDGSAILVDAGLNSKNIYQRLAMLNLNPASIKAIFLTHEHIDHIRGCDVFARSLKIPIFATQGTIMGGFLCSDESLIHKIKKDTALKIEGFDVKAFSKSHKAAEPVSYIITDSKLKKTASVITDLGYSCKNTNNAISLSDFIFLESNHDINMLEEGHYPHFLKNWIKGDSGHLSNMQASLAILEHASPKLKNVVLSHLSRHNNSSDVALKTFNTVLKERSNFKASVSVSLENSPTQLFSL